MYWGDMDAMMGRITFCFNIQCGLDVEEQNVYLVADNAGVVEYRDE